MAVKGIQYCFKCKVQIEYHFHIQVVVFQKRPFSFLLGSNNAIWTVQSDSGHSAPHVWVPANMSTDPELWDGLGGEKESWKRPAKEAGVFLLATFLLWQGSRAFHSCVTNRNLTFSSSLHLQAAVEGLSPARKKVGSATGIWQRQEHPPCNYLIHMLQLFYFTRTISVFWLLSMVSCCPHFLPY